ncbi:MAG: phosphopantetheine adenylyltransferase [Deltaproteobacteria bacterium]|nr:phosphopantetheine adenylyltransferase [Deltaproteobacteria bacterium]
MHTFATILICLAGVINFLPVIGALSGKRIRALYGVTVEDSSSEILLRHRAVLFGIVGALIIASAFDASLRPAGYAAGFTAMLGFILIARLVGNYNANLRRVAMVDVVGLAALLGAALIDYCA